nr:hypothetical protein [Tanacetum cinerariifolium]
MEGNLPTWVEDSDDTTEGEESDLQIFFDYDDASISGLSSDFPTWVSDNDVSINGMEDDWMLDPYHNGTGPLVYEDVRDEDVAAQLTDLSVYEEFWNKYVVQHATDPIENANVGEIEGAKSSRCLWATLATVVVAVTRHQVVVVANEDDGGGHEVKKYCVCSPTKHHGSFRCRYHHSEYVFTCKASPLTTVVS